MMNTVIRFGIRKWLVLAAAIAVLAGAWIAWAVGGTDLLLGVVLVAVLGGIAALGVFLAQVERRLDTGRRPSLQLAATGVVDGMSQDEMLQLIARRLELIDDKIERPGVHAEQLLRAVNASHRRMEIAQEQATRDLVSQIAMRSDSSSDEDMAAYRPDGPALFDWLSVDPAPEIEAVTELLQMLGADAGVPLLGGWRVSPRSVVEINRLAIDAGAELVVVCGAGTSVLFLARSLRDRPGVPGQVVAFDSDGGAVTSTRRLLAHHGVDHVGEVRHAPAPFAGAAGGAFDEGASTLWPDSEALGDLQGVDLLVVPTSSSLWDGVDLAGVYPALRHQLSDEAMIVLTDPQDDRMRTVAARWIADGDLEDVSHPASSNVVLRRTASSHDRGTPPE